MQEKVLDLLQQDGDFLSGQQISNELGITRAAVWKHVRSLKAKGAVISAVRSKGYKLHAIPDLAAEVIRSKAHSSFWKKISVFDLLDSTNDLAMFLLSEGRLEPGTVIISDMQRKGKGRIGRRWISPPGRNIHMSLCIRPEIETRDISLLTVLAAVSAVEAIVAETDLPISLKWPNDIICSGKKLGGILTDVKAEADRVHYAVIGVGINVNYEYRDMPQEISSLATSIAIETGTRLSRNLLIARLLTVFERWYMILMDEGKDRLLDIYKQSCSTLNKLVRAEIRGGLVTGIAEDIDENGMLLVRTDSGKLMKVSSGDIHYLR